MNNVFKEELARDLGPGRSISLHHPNPVCYDSEVYVSTAKTYDSAGFVNINKRPILEELTMPLLWAFNVPIEDDSYVKYVRDLISQNV